MVGRYCSSCSVCMHGNAKIILFLFMNTFAIHYSFLETLYIQSGPVQSNRNGETNCKCTLPVYLVPR